MQPFPGPAEPARGSSLDVTIPVLDEERAIEGSLTTLTAFLAEGCPYEWTLTVADNGSTDGTYALAGAFAAAHPRVRVVRLAEKGRGRALKRAWSTSEADVVAYMDVDLSTGLESLRPLVDPILGGSCELSVGSRLAPGARVVRSLRREVVSRTYNTVARACLRYGVLDAQCGFKAIRADVARMLLPRIRDDGWFFDTELLTLAHREGLRINEVPVRWVEDTDSRVKVLRTALDDLRGIRRLWRHGTDAAPAGGRQDRAERTATTA